MIVSSSLEGGLVVFPTFVAFDEVLIVVAAIVGGVGLGACFIVKLVEVEDDRCIFEMVSEELFREIDDSSWL